VSVSVYRESECFMKKCVLDAAQCAFSIVTEARGKQDHGGGNLPVRCRKDIVHKTIPVERVFSGNSPNMDAIARQLSCRPVRMFGRIASRGPLPQTGPGYACGLVQLQGLFFDERDSPDESLSWNSLRCVDQGQGSGSGG
jgi:hypothetical protein